MICAGSRNPPEAICLDYTWYANPRGICPFCRDDFAVLGDGTLRTHNADRGRVISDKGVVGTTTVQLRSQTRSQRTGEMSWKT